MGELSLAWPKGGGLIEVQVPIPFFVYNYLACVASVSLWFRVKERGRESETARKMAQVKERGGGGEERKGFLPNQLYLQKSTLFLFPSVYFDTTVF